MIEANNEALKNKENNYQDGGPFGAVIVKDGKIISRGHNQVLKKNDPTAHAEVEAIREAGKILNTNDLSECILYTSCYPCPMCLAASIWANIKTIYYGNTREDAANIGFRDNYLYEILNDPERELNMIRIDEDMTIKVFEDFKKNPTLY